MPSSSWQVAYVLVTLVALFLLGGATALAWRLRRTVGGASVATFSALGAGWIASIAVMALADPATAAVLLKVKYLFVAFVPVPIAWFVLQATGRLPTRRRGLLLAALCAIPTLTQLVVWTDAGRGWMFASAVFERDGLLTRATELTYGPYYWIATGYCYGLLMASIVLAMAWTLQGGRLARTHGLAVAAGLAAPLATSMVHVMRVSPGGVDPMPIGLGLSVLLIGGAVLRHRMLDITPIGRGLVVDAMDDGMLASDADGRVVDINPAMTRVLGVSPRDAIGRPATTVLERAGDLAARFAADDGEPGNRTPLATIGTRHYAVRIVPLPSRAGLRAGRLMLLHDLTQHARMERERERLIGELRQALGQVRTLRGLLPLCGSCNQVRDAAGRWQPVDAYIRAHSEATVSRGMCPDCTARRYPDAYRTADDAR